MLKAGCFGRCCAIALIISVGGIVQLAVASNTTAASAHPVNFSCTSIQCGMPPHGAFPDFVVGRVAAIADAWQAGALFTAMRQHGRWSGLPADGKAFWKNLQPVAIDAGDGSVFITLTSQAEMHAAPLHVGDFVRYSPHRGTHEVPPTDKIAAAYWGVDGCVAVLCRASDRQCPKRYATGIFRAADGVQLSSRTLVPLKDGAVIDTGTMVPQHHGEMN